MTVLFWLLMVVAAWALVRASWTALHTFGSAEGAASDALVGILAVLMAIALRML